MAHNVQLDIEINNKSTRCERLRANFSGVTKNVVVCRKKLTQSDEVLQKRAGYAEAIMMQQYGEVNNRICHHCGNSSGPFTECRSVAGEHNGACANCHFQQRAAYCSLNARIQDPARTPEKKKAKRGSKRARAEAAPVETADDDPDENDDNQSE
ncbi:uncharacterized protein Z518_02581 [Rhinocladiella mackenziei CBS 650.93]|uniref:Uncharacterized protein n=1 Tax=Rhinocladiella mackenziei CBS 650.93 TaxID=1442369 RepID=A0A0D2G059_9EURO|nr:uncharacterized protein Z518_02581 [Rhinocladiella mackenziei CBS 650.93]KIX07927.1 hypothetical protein Z518_02581 [Rhinocladiella mackenziei CBS 650.93]